MDVPTVGPIQLSDEERQLFELVDYSEHDLANLRPENPEQMFAASVTLTHLLLDRDAIPPVRIRYFDDPELNVRGHGKSRHAVFVSNGCTGDDIFRHPHFFKYLRYFVCGPDLPRDVIDGFRQIVVDDRGTSGEILKQLCGYARAQTKRLKTRERYDLHEEFFKLALECGVPDSVALAVRKAAQSAR